MTTTLASRYLPAGRRKLTPGFEIIDDLFFNERTVFMKAYCDESGKHDRAIFITICGLLMSAKTCKELQRRWFKEAARSPNIPMPFHASDCAVGRKHFQYLEHDEPAKGEYARVAYQDL